MDYDGNGIGHVLIDFASLAKLKLIIVGLCYFVQVNASDDVIIDFGDQLGIWVLANETTWFQLHPFSSEAINTADLDNNGQSDVIIDFGEQWGIWIWMNTSVWIQLHSLSPELLETGDIDGNGQEDIVMNFSPPLGVWAWMNNNIWIQLHDLTLAKTPNITFSPESSEEVFLSQFPMAPQQITLGDIDDNGQDEVFIDFGEFWNVQRRMNNSGFWIPFFPFQITEQQVTFSISTESPVHMISADVDGNGMFDLFFDYGEQFGIWQQVNFQQWTQLHPFTSKRMVSGDLDGNGQEDLIIDFGEQWGVWVLFNNSTWFHLHSFTSEVITVGDMDHNGQSDVIIDFGNVWGIWTWVNNQAWVQLHDLSPEQMVTGDVDGL